MGQSLFQRSLAGGELAPVLHARADTAKYVTAAKTVKNFIVRREGGVSNRPGLRYVATAKTATFGTKLMRFVSNVANQSVLIEMGSGCFRFFRNGAAVKVTGVAAWSGATNYTVGDLVVSAGVNYYCVQAHINQVPPNATYWYALTADLYEIPTPYSLANLPQWGQSGNVITLTNPNVAPMELTFVTLTRWILTAVATGIKQAAPTALAGTGGNPVPAWVATVQYQVGAIVSNGGTNYTCVQSNLNQAPPNATYWLALAATALDRIYVVTALATDTLEESIASATKTIAGFLVPVAQAPNALSWTPPAGTVDSYNVYCDPFGNGNFGFIGSSATAAFNDAGFTPDFQQVPPTARVLFGNPNEYPSASAYFQQRRFFANTNLQPDGVFGSKTGFNSNFGISTPIADDDAITFRLAGNNHHPVRHLVALKSGLVLLTDGGEWAVTGGGGPNTPITPSSINADQDTYVGADATVRPVVIGSSIIYLQTRGSIVRQLQFQQQVEGLAGKDMTVFATHLFEGKTIVGADFQQVPDSVIWCVRSDGVLLGLTYIPEQDVWGWHRHETWQNADMGLIEDVCVVPESNEDGVYVIVKRTINGAAVRYIERMNTRVIRDGFFNADCFFVDGGLSYSGVPVSSFTGLDHLKGQVVAVVADGRVIYNGDPTGASAAGFTLPTSGTIGLTLPLGTPPASNVHIGLAIRYPDLETLDIDLQGSNVRDKQKAVHSITLLLDKSSRSFYAGPDEASLTQFAPETWESAAPQDTGQFRLRISANWNPYGRVLIRQTDPLPLTILGILPNVEAGG